MTFLFGYLLNYIYGFVNNYGLAIIIFTIILKLVMLSVLCRMDKLDKIIDMF